MASVVMKGKKEARHREGRPEILRTTDATPDSSNGFAPELGQVTNSSSLEFP